MSYPHGAGNTTGSAAVSAALASKFILAINRSTGTEKYGLALFALMNKT